MTVIGVGESNTAWGKGQKKSINGNGVVDSSGDCDLEFPPCPAGMYWTGTITVFSSPSGIQWSINVNSQQVDVAFGQQSIGGIQVGNGDQLIVSATNLGAYIGQTLNATFAVIESPDTATPLITPGHDALNQLSGYSRIVLNQHVTVANNVQVFNLSPTDRAVIALCYPSQVGDSTTASIAQIQGVLTGVDYLASAVPVRPLTNVGSVLGGPVMVPVLGSIESQCRITISTGAGTQIVVIATPDPVLYNNLEPQLTLDFNYINTVYSIAKVNAATNTTTPLLATPAAGTYWEIARMGLWQVANGTVAQHLAIQGHTTGSEYLICTLAATAPGNQNQLFADNKFVISEGLDVVNGGTGTTGSGMAIYRSVPNTYNPG